MRATRLRELLAVSLLVIAPACGFDPPPDVGDDDGDDAPDAGIDADPGTGTAAFVFPPGDGITEGTSIHVRGTASDADGIAAVRVNGVAALSSDGFAHWQADVELEYGPN